MAKVPKSGLREVHIDIGSHNVNPSRRDERFSLAREYVGDPSGKPVYVLRFVSHYIASTPVKKDADAMKKAVIAAHSEYPLSVKQMQNVAAEYSDLGRGKNPAPRIGTARPRRPSQITKKAPSKRLVARRSANTRRGYFPNPSTESTRLKKREEALTEIRRYMRNASVKQQPDLQRQARISHLQGYIEGVFVGGLIVADEARNFYEDLKVVAHAS